MLVARSLWELMSCSSACPSLGRPRGEGMTLCLSLFFSEKKEGWSQFLDAETAPRWHARAHARDKTDETDKPDRDRQTDRQTSIKALLPIPSIA